MLMIFTYIFSRSFLFVLHSRTCAVVFSTFMHLRPGPRLRMGCGPSTRRAAHGLARSRCGLLEIEASRSRKLFMPRKQIHLQSAWFDLGCTPQTRRKSYQACTTAFQVRTVGPDGDSNNLAILNTGFSSPYGSLTNDLQ